MSEKPLETAPAQTEQGDRTLHTADAPFDFRGPWFNAKTAAAYVPCKTVKAWYVWRVRHGIIARSNGSVAKADLDRVLNRRKPRRVMAPASLANLHRHHARQSAVSGDSAISPIFGQKGI
jgi:hypothetical protein